MKRRLNPGFTLVELLVVIGIIALLISILLPALANARRAAVTTVCEAKLHNIMQAAMLHRQDHGDYYPLAGVVPASDPTLLNDTYARKYDYYSYIPAGGLGRTLCTPIDALITEMASVRSLPGTLGSFTSEAQRISVMLDSHSSIQAFMCPAQTNIPMEVMPLHAFATLTLDGSSFEEPQSYIFNEYILGYDDPYNHLRGKASQIRQPSLTMFAADGVGGATSAHGSGPSGNQMITVYNKNTNGLPVTLADAYASNTASTPLAGDFQNFDKLRHKNKINIAFCDGHVANFAITPGDLIKTFIAAP